MNQSIKVEKTVTINKPVEELYRFWHNALVSLSENHARNPTLNASLVKDLSGEFLSET